MTLNDDDVDDVYVHCIYIYMLILLYLHIKCLLKKKMNDSYQLSIGFETIY